MAFGLGPLPVLSPIVVVRGPKRNKGSRVMKHVQLCVPVVCGQVKFDLLGSTLVNGEGLCFGAGSWMEVELCCHNTVRAWLS